MSVLVFAEISDGKFKKATFEAVSYGRQVADMLGTEVVALAIGNGVNTADLGQYGAQTTIHLHGNTPTQPIQHQGLLRLRKPNLPWRTGMRQGRQGRSPRPTLIARDRHMIRPRLGNAGGDRAHTHF